MSLPFDLWFANTGEIVEPLVGGMVQLDDPAPVLLRRVGVPLQLRPRRHAEPGYGRGGQGRPVRLCAEGVEDKVGAEDKVPLGGGGLGAGRAKDEPAGVHGGGRLGGDLRTGLVL